ncbi:transposase [Brucella anthropi]
MFPPRERPGGLSPGPCGRSFNAIFYVLCGGIAWRLLPSDFSPWPTLYR